MSSIIDRLITSYPDQKYIHTTSKDEALGLLKNLSERIREMEDFTQFPEGTGGVIIYAMLNKDAESCPDAGDLSLFCQGYETLLRHTCHIIAPTLF